MNEGNNIDRSGENINKYENKTDDVDVSLKVMCKDTLFECVESIIKFIYFYY